MQTFRVSRQKDDSLSESMLVVVLLALGSLCLPGFSVPLSSPSFPCTRLHHPTHSPLPFSPLSQTQVSPRSSLSLPRSRANYRPTKRRLLMMILTRAPPCSRPPSAPPPSSTLDCEGRVNPCVASAEESDMVAGRVDQPIHACREQGRGRKHSACEMSFSSRAARRVGARLLLPQRVVCPRFGRVWPPVFCHLFHTHRRGRREVRLEDWRCQRGGKRGGGREGGRGVLGFIDSP